MSMNGPVDDAAHATPVELVRQAAGGDLAAMTRLIRRYQRTALGLAYAITGDADLAGDVAQDALLRAWQRLRELREPEKFESWLCGIVRNLAADSVRRARSRSGAVMRLAQSAGERSPDNPPAELEEAENARRIDAALAKLDEVTRSAVVLRYYDGLPSRQIAQLLGLSPAAVDMRLSRARQELRELLQETA